MKSILYMISTMHVSSHKVWTQPENDVTKEYNLSFIFPTALFPWHLVKVTKTMET